MPRVEAGAALLDAFGRRGTLLKVAAPLYVCGWTATALSRSATELIGARIVVGAGVGIASVAVPVYIAETSPASLRGSLGAVNQLAVTLGIFVLERPAFFLILFFSPPLACAETIIPLGARRCT